MKDELIQIVCLQHLIKRAHSTHRAMLPSHSYEMMKHLLNLSLADRTSKQFWKSYEFLL